MQTVIIDRQKIDSLQALRAWAFLGIFFSHANFFIKWPTLGVSVFFVLSGFLMTYRYEKAELSVFPKDCFFFSWKKIKKLYPLHIITMVCAIVLSVVRIMHNGLRLRSIVRLCGTIFLNVTLLQTWIPYSSVNVSLNGVAWYLSVTLFLYFMFPRIIKVVEQNSIIKLCVICGIILIVEILACVPFIITLGNNSPIYIWFMYCFPVFRLGDFFTGCVLKRLFFERNIESMETRKATIYEVLATMITVFVFLWLKQKHSSVILLALHNWTTLYIPIAAIWVVLFAANKGLLTRILTNKVTLFVGNISAYAFLIHYVITQYTKALLSYLNIEVDGWSKAIIVFAELMVSIGLSVLYKYLHEKYISKLLFMGNNKAMSQ